MGNRAVIISHDTNKENAKEKIDIYLQLLKVLLVYLLASELLVI